MSQQEVNQPTSSVDVDSVDAIDDATTLSQQTMESGTTPSVDSTAAAADTGTSSVSSAASPTQPVEESKAPETTTTAGTDAAAPIDSSDTTKEVDPAAAPTDAESSTAADKEKAEPVELIHAGFTCDGCKMNPIVGVRFNCLNKDCDYDLCQECMSKPPHPLTDTHKADHVLHPIQGKPREPEEEDKRTPWMIIMDNTMDLLKWFLPLVDDETMADILPTIEAFQAGRTQLTEIDAEGKEWGQITSINWMEKVISVITERYLAGYGRCMRLFDQSHIQDLEAEEMDSVTAFMKITRVYLETLATLVKPATQRLHEQQQLVDADRATVAAAKAAGITLKEDEYDQAAADENTRVYCAMQYELYGYFRAYYLLIQVIDRGNSGIGFELIKVTFPFWLRFCFFIMRAKDRYCLCVRQLCVEIVGLLLKPENDEIVQFLFNGEDVSNSLLSIAMSTIYVLSGHDGVLGGDERPGLSDLIRESSKAGGPLEPGAFSECTSNGQVGLALMQTFFKLKTIAKDEQNEFNVYCPLIPSIARFCSLVLDAVKDEVAPQENIPSQIQLTGLDMRVAPETVGRIDLLAVVTMQAAIMGGYDSRYYAEDPTRIIPVFTHFLRLVENPKIEPKIRSLIARSIAQAVTNLPNEITPLIYEQYQLLYSDESIPAEKRLPVVHRLMGVLETLIITDPIEKYYTPFDHQRLMLMWAISRCARLIPMKELLRNAPKPSPIVPSSSDEQKENDVGLSGGISPLTGPLDANGELRNIFVWLMDILEIFMTNHPMTRSDGHPNPFGPNAKTDAFGDRWSLHPGDIEVVSGLIEIMRSLDDATPRDRLNNTIARTHWAPFLPRVFPLLLNLQELLPPNNGIYLALKTAGLGLIDDIVRFIPKLMVKDARTWSRLQAISDAVLSTPLTFTSKAEEDYAWVQEEIVNRGREAILERCQKEGRFIPIDLVNLIEEEKKERKLTKIIELRSLYAEHVHTLRSQMVTVQGRLLHELWSNYDLSVKAKLLPHLLRTLPSNYGTLPKTEEDELQAKEKREEKEKEQAEKAAAKEAAKAEANEAKERARAERAAARAGEGGVEQPDEEEEQQEDEEDGEDEEEDDEEEDEDEDDEKGNIHSSPGADEDRSSAMYVICELFEQAPFTPATEKVDELYDSVWPQVVANHSGYGNETTQPLVLMTKYLPLVKPMALDKKWRPGEVSILPPTLQQQLTENVDLGIEMFKTSTRSGIIERIFIGWGELLKGYGLAALGEGSDLSTETINRREAELISYAMIIIRFAHPCQHDLETTEPEGFDADTWKQRLSAVDDDYDADEKKAGLEHWRSKIATQFHAKVHLHGSCCSDWDCYYDDLVNLAHHCCEFLAHLARARGSSFETRHKRVWKHLSYSAEKIPWRGALGCYWTGVAESLGSEGFDTYKADVFEYMINNLTIKESQGLFLGQSAYCLGNIFMHIDLPRIQSYLPRTLDALLQAHGYAQNKLDAHYKAMIDGTRAGLCQGVERQSWHNCHDGITIALGKILMVASSLMDVSSRLDELLRVFLSSLPLRDLIDDQKVVYSAVIKLINTFPQQHPGKIEPYYPRILEIFATILDLNLGKHRILPQLEKFILMGAKSILKQQPQLRQTVILDEWKDRESGNFGQRFIERIDGKPITSITTAL